MKQRYILLWLLVGSAVPTHAQSRLGVKLAPGIAYNSTYAHKNNTGFASKGMGLKFKIGVTFDYNLPIQDKDNYYFSTGLCISGQRTSINHGEKSVDETHQLQYLQVPLLLKLCTSEVRLDTKLYVELGPVIGVRIKQPVSAMEGDQEALAKDFSRMVVSAIMGIGAEYDTGLSTSLFAGLSYQAGWTSALSSQNESFELPEVSVYNNIISLVLGVKF